MICRETAKGTHELFASRNIVRLTPNHISPVEPLLLERESLSWRVDDLSWDYREHLELNQRCLEARALSGCVAYENGNRRPAIRFTSWKNKKD